jgi:hypothetical protein
MSTRAGIIIKDEGGTEIHFYRHSDGYPRGTMPTLRKFLNLVKKGKIRDNASQAAGWLILIGAKEYNYSYNVKTGKQINRPAETMFSPSLKEKKRTGMGWKVGAYEPTTNVENHGDLEYIYTIDLKEKEITVRKV